MINYRTFIVSAILPYSGFLIGLLMSLITRQNRERLIAIFIESGRSMFVMTFWADLIDEMSSKEGVY